MLGIIVLKDRVTIWVCSERSQILCSFFPNWLGGWITSSHYQKVVTSPLLGVLEDKTSSWLDTYHQGWKLRRDRLPRPPYLMQPMDTDDLYDQWWGWWWGRLGIPPRQRRRSPSRYCSLQGPCAWWGLGREQSSWTWAKRRSSGQAKLQKQVIKKERLLEKEELIVDHLSVSSSYCSSLHSTAFTWSGPPQWLTGSPEQGQEKQSIALPGQIEK